MNHAPRSDKSLWDLKDELRQIDDRIRQDRQARMAAQEQLKTAKPRAEVQQAQQERQALFAQQEAAQALAEAAANLALKEQAELNTAAAGYSARALALDPVAGALVIETVQNFIDGLLASIQAAEIQRAQVLNDIEQLEEQQRQDVAAELAAAEVRRARREALMKQEPNHGR